MAYVDLILNLACLLLWLNWRSIRFDPLTKRTPATLMGTLRPAAPTKKLRPWHLLVLIAIILFLRAALYRWIGPADNDWVGKLDLGVTVLPFRSNWFGDMLVFSYCSFALAIGIFYLCLLPLSLLAGPEPMHSLVKIPLGNIDDWPWWAKAIMPLAISVFCWWAGSWLFCWLKIMPEPVATAQRLEQGVVIGLDGYLVWRFPLGVILLLHLLSSYIYFGKHPIWKYVNETSQKLLLPLQQVPLRVGRMDFAPLVGIVVIFAFANLLENGMKALHVHGLIGLYSKLPL